MTQRAIETAKKALTRRRASLSRVRAANDAGILGLSAQKQEEGRAEVSELSGVLVALSDRERIELNEINAALKRIEDGTWGVCQVCGSPISAKRLAAVPEAVRCAEHAQ